MKIIHTADLHLGAPIDSALPPHVANDRKAELRKAFNSMVEYANAQRVSAIMLVGDVFDRDEPFKRDKDFFLSVVNSYPNIDFLYLRGNHDNSEDFKDGKPKNLITFSDSWSSVRYGNVVISGIEITSKNVDKYPYLLNLNENDINIVMLHGQVSESADGEIVPSRLKDKNINYLALGHIHKAQEHVLDNRANYYYSGCLVGRGFDECGEKGFRLLEVGDKITSKFIKSDVKPISKVAVDVSGAKDEYEVYKIVKDGVKEDKNCILKIELIGEISFDDDGLCAQLEKMLAHFFYYVYVKNLTVRKFNLDELKNDLSLKGEFLRSVLQDESLSYEQKNTIVSIGLKALDGKEIELWY